MTRTVKVLVTVEVSLDAEEYCILAPSGVADQQYADDLNAAQEYVARMSRMDAGSFFRDAMKDDDWENVEFEVVSDRTA